MRRKTILTIMMLVVGVVACGCLGIAYMGRGIAANPGPLEMMMDKTSTLAVPSIAGSMAFVGGIVLLVMGRKKG